MLQEQSRIPIALTAFNIGSADITYYLDTLMAPNCRIGQLANYLISVGGFNFQLQDQSEGPGFRYCGAIVQGESKGKREQKCLL